MSVDAIRVKEGRREEGEMFCVCVSVYSSKDRHVEK